MKDLVTRSLAGAVAEAVRASNSLRAGYCVVASQLPSSVTTPFGGPKSIRQRAVPDIDVPLTVPVKRESGVSMSKRTLFPSTVPSLTDPERTGADDVPRGPEQVS